MRDMRNNLGNSVSDLGIEIIDFRVKRIDLPPELSNSVYERMRSERNRLAEELRAQGNELSNEIRSAADKQRVIHSGRCLQNFEQIRGEGDAKAAAIYAISVL